MSTSEAALDMVFDYRTAAKAKNISANDLRSLEDEVSREFPNDPMLMELHVLRAIRAYDDTGATPMTTITITLADDLAKQAEEKGLLSSTALAHIIGEAMKSGKSATQESQAVYPPDFDPLLVGAVNPLAFKRGKIVGDVVSPIDVEWEANS